MAWSTPYIAATGDIITAAEWNGLANDLTFLYGDSAWTAVSSFSNGWVNIGTPSFNVAYRLAGATVWLRGGVKTGTASTAAFVLPSGYRPTATIEIACYGSGGASAAVSIDSSGNVIPTLSAGTWLDNVRFDTLA